jgi:hypothetical protein
MRKSDAAARLHAAEDLEGLLAAIRTDLAEQ